jgi:molybdopterin biosynthesis enzyme
MIRRSQVLPVVEGLTPEQCDEGEAGTVNAPDQPFVGERKEWTFARLAYKFPREGAGLLSSLVDTDGVVELGEDRTRVEPGTIVSCLPYASLL